MNTDKDRKAVCPQNTRNDAEGELMVESRRDESPAPALNSQPSTQTFASPVPFCMHLRPSAAKLPFFSASVSIRVHPWLNTELIQLSRRAGSL